MSRNVRSCDPANFSRMRSEGFPFIVGVWGWTYVRVVLVVGSSSDTRRIVIFLPLGSPHTMRQNHFLQTMKSAGSMKSKVMKSGASNSQDGRSVLCFAWQARYFGVSMQARRFLVAGAALCNAAFRTFVAGAALCDVAHVLFP